ncbi:MAG: hypothetical protein KF724_11820 [Phycisphaeraceae bacterium]|nr:hypothetical protein [Phycisphaeraceae bacterium]
MSRQTIIWALIGLLFVGFISFRALAGRMGRIYVEPKVQAFEEVPADPIPWADQGDRPPRATWNPVTPPAGAIDRRGVWQETDQSGAKIIGWTSWREIKATEVFEARAEALRTGGREPESRLSWPRTIGLWLAALFTLAAFSFLYRDNPFYKFTESVVVGASAAYYMVVGFWDVLVPKLFGALVPWVVREVVQPTLRDPSLADRLAMAAALVLGVMLLMQLVPKVRWMGVWPLAFIIGTFAGLKLFTFIDSDLLGQLRAATAQSPLVVVKELVPGQPLGTGEMIWQSFLASLQNSLLLIGTVCTLFYFFFSMEQKGAAGRVARVGVWFLMITFGAVFGFTVMGRVTLLAKRFEFLFDDWLWLIDPRGVHQLVSTILGVVAGA